MVRQTLAWPVTKKPPPTLGTYKSIIIDMGEIVLYLLPSGEEHAVGERSKKPVGSVSLSLFHVHHHRLLGSVRKKNFLERAAWMSI